MWPSGQQRYVLSTRRIVHQALWCLLRPGELGGQWALALEHVASHSVSAVSGVRHGAWPCCLLYCSGPCSACVREGSSACPNDKVPLKPLSARLAEGCAQRRRRRRLELDKLGEQARVRPILGRRRAQRLEDLAQLVQVALARQPRAPQQQLCD